MLEGVPGTLLRRSSLTALLAAAAVAAAAQGTNAATLTPATYALAVRQICAHAMLFERSHPIGTRAGALELAADIRASTRRRLARIAALPAPRSEHRPIARWVAVERQLAATYALDYVRIYDLIAEPRTTPAQRTRAARRLALLVHDADRLRRIAARRESQLQVPDCTGGSAGRDSPSGGILGVS
jgi:hypothetical protein